MVQVHMPLYPDAEKSIRGNFALIKKGRKPRPVAIGYLTEQQLADINNHRATKNQLAIQNKVYFVGTHIYNSRVVGDSYDDDMLVQLILSALSEDFQFMRGIRGTALQRTTPRIDKHGHKVCDEMVLECTVRHPFPELFSIVPRGDGQSPTQKKKKAAEAASP